MNWKAIITEIHKIQLENFSSIQTLNENSKLLGKPKGWYWIWSNVDENLMREVDDREIPKRHVPISKLTKQRVGLKNICNVKVNDYKIIYNGIGGGNTNKYNLKSRIKKELNCKNEGTGTLNLFNKKDKYGNAIFEPINTRVSYLNLEDSEQCSHLFDLIGISSPDIIYEEYKIDIELLWRLEYGVPILCRH